MPLLRDIVQPEKGEEGTALSAAGSWPPAETGACSRGEKRRTES